jgi:HNH endonuclease
MSRSYVPKALRERVAQQAKYRCGYCLTPEWIVGTPMEIDHIVPEASGGPTDEDNLWLVCSLCNQHKAKRLTAYDPETRTDVPLFDPRHQRWREHFLWSESGDVIIGLSPTGRATVAALHLNRDSLVSARQRWVSVGWHPPEE